MKFNDNVGVILSSPSKLSLNATEEIIMKTPGEIEIKASNNIFLGKTNTNSGIAIENEFNLLSNKVIQDGEERKTFKILMTKLQLQKNLKRLQLGSTCNICISSRGYDFR